MTKLNHRDKAEIEKILAIDLRKVQTAMNGQLEAYWTTVRETIVEEIGIKEKMAEAERLAKEIEEKKLELQRIREKMQHEIVTAERLLADIRATAVGEYSGPPSADQLKDLGLFNHDESIENRRWYGFKIATKLDAATALRLRASADIGTPIQALEQIGESIAREMKFVSTFEQAKEVYAKFHDLGFREMGVDLVPMLDDVKGLRGEKLLETGLIEETRRIGPGTPSAEPAKE